MEKLGVSLGGGPSRKELLEAVEQQKAELQRYQARLRDLVRAYKSLLTEKAALEASLRALSASPGRDAHAHADPGAGADPPEPGGGGGGGGGGSAPSEESVVGLRVGPGAEEEPQSQSQSPPPPPPGEEEREEAQLKAQLATLASALATVAQEKSRMEASYQADKKKTKQETEEARRRAAEERHRLEAELAETRARLVAQQQDRAQEQSDHAVMLRELQRLVQSERALRQEAELSLEEARQALAGKSCAADRAEGSERQARQLAQEVGQLKRELQAVREESCRPDLRLQELQAEMAGLRSHFQALLLQETRKAARADEHVQMGEQRVASLEAQISEMSELLGTYEKAKQKDQMTIQKLKDRIVQLDLENKTLAVAASGHSALSLAIEEGSVSVNVLKDKMEMLRKLTQVATEDTRTLTEAVEASGDMESGDGEKATAAYYQQELKQLKEEFERYKVRAQVVLKNKSAKDGNLARELEDTQEQLAKLKEKYVSLRLSWEEAAKQQEEQLEAKRREASLLQQLHRQELERCRLGCQEKVLWLEEEMHKQRDRALAVLAEKDQELEQLRVLALPYGLQGSKALEVPGPREPPRGGGDGSSNHTVDSSLENLTQALHLAAPNEPIFFLYTEQLARKEVEVLALKKEKHRLEMEVHQFQEKVLEVGEKHKEEVSVLQGRIQKTIRDQSREGANLEYLKNIFYRFLTLTDWLGRQQTLTAILTILHFSPEERQAVLNHAGGGSSWWLSGKR